MPQVDLDRVQKAVLDANKTTEDLRILLKLVASRQNGLDDKFERLNQSANYNFDLLNRQIADAKAILLQQIQIQKINREPGVKDQLTAFRDQIKNMEQLAKQFKQYQGIQIEKRHDHLLKANWAKVPKRSTDHLVRQLPRTPTNDPLMALLKDAKASTLDPKIGDKIKYIRDCANAALNNATKGMNAQQIAEFNQAMSDGKSSQRHTKMRFDHVDPMIALMKINPHKLDPAIGSKVKMVQDAIKNAYTEVTKDLSANKRVEFNLELKKDQQVYAEPETRKGPRR